MDAVRALWDFDDLDATEARLREALGTAPDAVGRAELLTQLARVEGLRGAFDAGDALLREAELAGGSDALVAVRVALERGRLRRSAGDPDAAQPPFEDAYVHATAEGLWFLAADAAHMLALVADQDGDGFVAWTQRGIELAETHDEAAYWAGPLLNNLGWELLGRGNAAAALAAFRRALAARERDGDPQSIEIARFAVGRALRELGRAGEAIPLLETAVAWSVAEGRPDGWFHEELAEELAAVGRTREAALQAALALPLLEAADPSLADDAARRGRLLALAAGR